MKIGLQLCFELNSVSGSLYQLLFDKYVSFTPYGFTKGIKTKAWNANKHLREFAIASSNGEPLSAYDLNSNIFSVGKTGTNSPHLSILIVQEKNCFLPSEYEINELIVNNDGFIAAYLYDEEYHQIQSEKFPSNLDHRNISQEKWDSIKNTPYKMGVHNFEYNTHFNAGRKVLLQHTFIMSCWKMWFGHPFFKLVPKEKLVSFPFAEEIKELPNGQMFVKLFENVDHSHTPDAMFRQWKWQECIEFDNLEVNYS
jgi:hypothetical protein